MQYQLEFKPQALHDLAGMDRVIAHRVMRKIERMRNDLAGDVKRLTNFNPSYRLRVGDYRVIFEVDGKTVTIYYVRHRRDAYNG